MRYFFTADWHLWHAKILLLANRQFVDIEEHNATLRSNINTRLRARDHLVILGDVALGDWKQLSKWLDSLVTKNLHLVYGNHDEAAKRLVKWEPLRFQRVDNVLEYNLAPANTGLDRPVHIFCSHYAHRVWNKSHYGSYHVYSHSHGQLPDDPKARSMDVGVDTNNYKPWEAAEIIHLLDKRDWQAINQQKDMTGIPSDVICNLCGQRKGRHAASTLHCPVGFVPVPDHPGLTRPKEYHPTQYFAPPKSCS